MTTEHIIQKQVSAEWFLKNATTTVACPNCESALTVIVATGCSVQCGNCKDRVTVEFEIIGETGNEDNQGSNN